MMEGKMISQSWDIYKLNLLTGIHKTQYQDYRTTGRTLTLQNYQEHSDLYPENWIN
jgi:hypothetical protein